MPIGKHDLYFFHLICGLGNDEHIKRLKSKAQSFSILTQQQRVFLMGGLVTMVYDNGLMLLLLYNMNRAEHNHNSSWHNNLFLHCVSFGAGSQIQVVPMF